jgi:hypothetical protein
LKISPNGFEVNDDLFNLEFQINLQKCFFIK